MPDVTVVGAGLSGLTAARTLHVAGADVRVLEARDRVGGRTFSVPLGGDVLDLGAQWVGPDQKRAHALAAGAGLELFPTPDDGQTLVELGGEQRRYTGTIPPLGLLDLAQLQRTIWSADLRSRWTARKPDRLARYHGLTLADWERERGLREPVRALIDGGMRVVFGAEADEIALTEFLDYAAAADGLMSLVETEGGAQDSRIVGGTQQLSQHLAGLLGDGVVRVQQRAQAIATRNGRLVVQTGDEEHVSDQLIVAVPPNIAREIRFDVELPPARRTWLDRSTMGATTKALVTYDRDFWHDDGLSGGVVCPAGDPITVVYDNSTPSGQAGLVCFVVGDAARRLTDPEVRRRAVLDRLADWFGEAARTPTAYRDLAWQDEPFTGGCPVALPEAGAEVVPRRDTVASAGAVHFAGTETATSWRGFLEGAIEAGERAARQALAGLVGARDGAAGAVAGRGEDGT